MLSFYSPVLSDRNTSHTALCQATEGVLPNLAAEHSGRLLRELLELEPVDAVAVPRIPRSDWLPASFIAVTAATGATSDANKQTRVHSGVGPAFVRDWGSSWHTV